MKKRSEDYKRWREKHPEYFKTEKFKLAKFKNSLKYRYGISLEQKQELFDLQEGLCPICMLELPIVTSVDCCVEHDHKTSRIRGLTHRACNLWVGFIEKHGFGILERIKNYL